MNQSICDNSASGDECLDRVDHPPNQEPRLCGKVIDRTETQLSPSYLPWSDVVLIPNEQEIIRVTEKPPHVFSRRRWTSFNQPGHVCKTLKSERDWKLQVRESGSLWTIHRSCLKRPSSQRPPPSTRVRFWPEANLRTHRRSSYAPC